MNNIELKIGVNSFRGIKKLLKEINAKESGILIQKDTYYNSKNNRLKLREINNREFVLIGYSRPDKESAKLSNYDLLYLDKDQAKTLKKIMRDSFGEKVIVKKKRELWIYENTRIHLDLVEGLGKFLEIETVVGEGTKKARKEYDEIYGFLKLDEFKKYKKSYSDLMIKKNLIF